MGFDKFSKDKSLEEMAAEQEQQESVAPVSGPSEEELLKVEEASVVVANETATPADNVEPTEKTE